MDSRCDWGELGSLKDRHRYERLNLNEVPYLGVLY